MRQSIRAPPGLSKLEGSEVEISNVKGSHAAGISQSSGEKVRKRGRRPLFCDAFNLYVLNGPAHLKVLKPQNEHFFSPENLIPIKQITTPDPNTAYREN
jgi:hypothetical protein